MLKHTCILTFLNKFIRDIGGIILLFMFYIFQEDILKEVTFFNSTDYRYFRFASLITNFLYIMENLLKLKILKYTVRFKYF